MKKKFLVAACAATMALGMSLTANAADTESGLVGYYTFNDTLANSASTKGGAASLHGGAGDTWNASATGTAAYAQGVNGKGYMFTGDVNGARGEGLELDAKTTGSDFTLSAWIKASDFGDGTTSMMFAINTVDLSNDAVFSLNTLNGFKGTVLFGQIWDWTHRNDTFVCLDGDNTDKIFSLDEWVHVTITGKSGEQKLYLNGEMKAESNSTNALVVDNLKNASIFLGINWWDKSFGGIMDDVSLFDRALSAEDVAALYANNGIPTVDTTDVAESPKTYAQYKKVADNNYTLRIVSEVAIEESQYANYKGIGFRCSKVESKGGDKYFGTNVYTSIKANGETITAAQGKCFVVLEITGVVSDAVLYVQPMSQDADSDDNLGNEVTVNMAHIIK